MRPVTFILPLILSLSLLAGCGGDSADHSPSPQDRAEAYRSAIEGARDQELNSAYPVVTDVQEDMGQAAFDLLGLEADDCQACALSVSLMNVKAYGIAAVYPYPGKEDTVYSALEDFIARQEQSFQQYLADQYDIASHARLDTLADGTVLLVMCEDQDEVFNSIRDAIEET